MISILRAIVKSIPTLILSAALAIAVWISAVNAADPIQQRLYPRSVTLERRNLPANLVLGGEVPTQVSVTLSAPGSVWDRISSDRAPVLAWIDLAGLAPGSHTLEVHVKSIVQPSKEVNWSPRTVTVNLEKLVSQELPIKVVTRGEPAVGYQAAPYTLSQAGVTVSGPSSAVARVKEARVTLDLTRVNDSINRALDVQVLDANQAAVEGVTIEPAQVTINQPITQRGGYRNVVVKVASAGQVASGYRLTNISVSPPTVTVFSTNPQLVASLPGFVETSPVTLTGVKDDFDVRLPLNLPDGVEVVGDQAVLVQVGVATIEGSVTLTGLPVSVEGLPDGFIARLSPETVDVIISGPVPLLDRMTENDAHVYLDLSGSAEGTFQLAPKVNLAIGELRVESILPGSIEVVVTTKAKAALTPSATPTRTPTPTATRPPAPTPTPTP